MFFLCHDFSETVADSYQDSGGVVALDAGVHSLEFQLERLRHLQAGAYAGVEAETAMAVGDVVAVDTAVIGEENLVMGPRGVREADEGVELPFARVQQRELRVEADEKRVAVVVAHRHRYVQRGADDARERILEEQSCLGAAVAADVSGLQAQHLLVPSGERRQ